MEGSFLEHLYCTLCPLAQSQDCKVPVRGKSQSKGTAVGSEEKQVFACTDSEASLQGAPPASTV